MNDFFSYKNKAFIFLIFTAVIIGPAYTICDHFDFSHSPDTKSYMKMAEGDFEVTITHRYRVLVPMLAAAVHAPVSYGYKTLWPSRTDANEKGLMLSFLLVNTLLLALAGLFIFLTCLHYDASPFSAMIGTLSFLTSSWTIYAAGLPLIDSLYILVIALTIWGIKTTNRIALLLAIFIGPFAKESFIFIAPLIVLFGRDTLTLRFQIILFTASGLLVFFFRYYLDNIMGTAPEASLGNAFNQFENISYTLHRVFSLRGIGEIARVWGVFTFVLFAGLTGKREMRITWLSQMGGLEISLIVSALIHMLISGDAGRMLYLASPVMAVAIALILDRHPYFESLKKKFTQH